MLFRSQRDTNINGSGTTVATSPGVRKIPRPMVPPMMAAIVNPLPRTRLGWYCLSLVLNEVPLKLEIWMRNWLSFLCYSSRTFLSRLKGTSPGSGSSNSRANLCPEKTALAIVPGARQSPMRANDLIPRQ